ncbi:MAG: hydroxymethylpyrimidine/phosphomethylpyrimidine kinase [Candidatus Thiodiazotropha sp.]
MLNQTEKRPVILAIGGHDPVGGAGIQADIESIGSNGCHAATAITCLTVQDTCNVRKLIPIPATTLLDQAQAVLSDCCVSAIKIGLLGHQDSASAVTELLKANPQIPVVFDPVLAAGGGSDLANEGLLSVIRDELLPLCHLLTPNTHEALRLSRQDQHTSLELSAQALLGTGARAVLVTGSHDMSDPQQVTHRLYRPNEPAWQSRWPRLAGEFHGSGCTLASAIAAGLARGLSLVEASQAGLAYTWATLEAGFAAGRCQRIPFRYLNLSHTGAPGS